MINARGWVARSGVAVLVALSSRSSRVTLPPACGSQSFGPLLIQERLQQVVEQSEGNWLRGSSHFLHADT